MLWEYYSRATDLETYDRDAVRAAAAADGCDTEAIDTILDNLHMAAIAASAALDPTFPDWDGVAAWRHVTPEVWIKITI